MNRSLSLQTILFICTILIFSTGVSQTEITIETVDKKLQYLRTHHSRNKDSSVIWANWAIKHSNELDYPLGQIQGHRIRAMVAYENAQYEKAILDYQKCLELLNNNFYPGEQIQYYHNMAIIHNDLGNKDLAFEKLLDAEKICKENDLTDLYSRIYSLIGYIYIDIDHEKSEKYLKLTHQHFRKGYKYVYQGIAINHLFLSELYTKKKQFEEAKNHIYKAQHVSDSIHWMPLPILVEQAFGRTFIESGELDSAAVHLAKGLEYAKQFNSQKRITVTQKLLGRLALAQKNDSLAEKHFRSALEISNSIKFSRDLLEISEGLTTSLANQGKFEEAHQQQKSYLAINDSINLSHRHLNILLMQHQNDYDKLVQQSAWEKQRLQYVLFFMVIIFIVTIIFVVGIFKYQRNKSARKSLEEKLLINQQKALQNEIENKNKELISKLMYLQQKTELNNLIASQLLKFKLQLTKKSNHEELDSIIDKLQKGENQKVWEEFERYFLEVYKSFYDKLQKKHPKLTPNERRLCAYLRMNLTSKEIAAITHQTINSIDAGRARLRKKFALQESNDNLVAYLAEF